MTYDPFNALADYRAVLDKVGDLIIVTDAQGIITYVNDACVRVSGFSRADMIGKKPSLLRSGRSDDCLYKRIWEALLAGKTWQGQLLNKRKNGSYFLVNARIWPLPGKSGSVAGYVAVEQDITEWERVRKAAEKQASLLGELSQRVPGLIFQLQMSTRPLRLTLPYASNSLEHFFGFSYAEVAEDAMLLFRRCFPDDVHKLKQSFLRAARGRKEWSCEFRVVIPGREKRWYLVNAQPDFYEDGVVMWSGYLSDITDRKYAEQELRRHADFMRKQNQILAQARHEAGQAVRAKSQFLANMSHEIRTPMNGVLGAAELLRETQLDEEQKEYVEIVRTGGNALMHVINGILEYSKLEAEKVTYAEDVFSLLDLIRECVGLLSPSARQKGLQLELNLPREQDREIIGDPNLLRRVLLNLGGNAIKFTHSGFVRFNLLIEQEGAAKVAYRCSIEDSGIGIPAEKREMIFEPFTQVDSSNTRHYGGSGLGLAICQQIIRGMGGTIGVDSTFGNGSCFWFRVSFNKAEAPSEEAHSAAKSAGVACRQGPALRPVANGEFSKHTVLLADDDPVNLRVIELHLSRRGLRVLRASNGLQAIKMLEEVVPNIIFMDCQMPVMDGFEATRRIRAGEAGEVPKSIPIIAITALALEGDSQRCLDAGMSDYISKPVRRFELDQVLRKWIL